MTSPSTNQVPQTSQKLTVSAHGQGKERADGWETYGEPKPFFFADGGGVDPTQVMPAGPVPTCAAIS